MIIYFSLIIIVILTINEIFQIDFFDYYFLNCNHQ